MCNELLIRILLFSSALYNIYIGFSYGISAVGILLSIISSEISIPYKPYTLPCIFIRGTVNVIISLSKFDSLNVLLQYPYKLTGLVLSSETALIGIV